jgi:hypothetical protein
MGHNGGRLKRIVNAAYLLCALAIGGTSLGAQVQPAFARPSTSARQAASRNLWRVSLIALTTANAVDIRSSWRKPELNPVLAQPSATFGWHAALVKIGISGAVMGIEYLAARRHGHPGLYRVLSIANFGSAAAVGAVAAHNYTLAAAQR